MGRKKIPMIYIEDDRKRASTFEKRRIGLFKKASELNRLCGVDISVIVVNKQQIYKFAEGPDKLSNPTRGRITEKIEENFTNDSLLDFIRKKGQKSATGGDSDSVDHESVEEQLNISTEDEEDPEFIHELEKNNLLESYHNLKPEISPIKGPNFELPVLNRELANEPDCRSYPMTLHGGGRTREQSAVDVFTPLYTQSFTNQMGFDQNGNLKEQNRRQKPDMNYINELLPISSTNSVYSFPNDEPPNLKWFSHKSNKPQHCQLQFDFNANCVKDYLETPEINNSLQQHLNVNLPMFQDLQEDPLSKRIKFSSESHNLTYF